MKQAYDCGINFFDTAESYSAGQSEIAMGKAIKKYGWKRNDLVISAKLNWGGAYGEILVNNHGLSRKHIIEGLSASLERLQLSYVDIIYAHQPDRLTPMEETVRAFNHVINQGQALYWGTSKWSADEITEACGIAKQLGMIGPIVEQPCYNVLERTKVEGEFQRLYTRCGIGLTTFSPLKMGMLSGKYEGAKTLPSGSRFAESEDKFAVFMKGQVGGEDWNTTVEKVTKLKPIAQRLGVTQSQLALAWCLKNENVASVITGASRPEQIVENVKCLQILDKLTLEIPVLVGALLASGSCCRPACSIPVRLRVVAASPSASLPASSPAPAVPPAAATALPSAQPMAPTVDPKRIRLADRSNNDVRKAISPEVRETTIPEHRGVRNIISGHNRAVSMPILPMTVYESIHQGFHPPTRTPTTLHEEISTLINDQYGPGPAEQDEDTPMIPDNLTNNSAESYRRYAAQPYVATSPSFGSPISISRATVNSTGPSNNTAAVDLDAGNTSPTNETSEAEFRAASQRAAAATRAACLLIRNAPNFNVAETWMEDLNNDLEDVIEDEHEFSMGIYRPNEN
ncbi:hypothetical protein VE04_09576 [Pseudogymnoascus sp. 24MN13]|nr:hypothetical protein VE04_09576 [Pseudogymnoascus sp. 24MN13]